MVHRVHANANDRRNQYGPLLLLLLRVTAYQSDHLKKEDQSGHFFIEENFVSTERSSRDLNFNGLAANSSILPTELSSQSLPCCRLSLVCGAVVLSSMKGSSKTRLSIATKILEPRWIDRA